MCFYVCGVFVVGGCNLYLLSACCMLCKRVEWVGVILVRFMMREVSSVCIVVVCLFRHADVKC